jgi:prepilin-type N-terminal cleavage/methylation domain-containing protein
MKNTYANKPNTLQGFTSLYPYTKPSIKHYSRQPAFTIVELLIVIVVIAILATISIAAYTNIQQRAKNTAIINAASQSLKMIEAYIAETGAYPFISATGYPVICITTDSGCIGSAGAVITGNTTFSGAMERVGQLPKNVPNSGDAMNGVLYSYNYGFEIDGTSQPALLSYWLQGTSQKCGVSGVISSSGNSLSTTGFSYNSNGKTYCRVSIPGPTHS